MSKLEELIQKLCPDGVEYKSIKDISTVSIGEFVHKKLQNKNGIYPVYNGGTSNTGFYDRYNRTANKIIISARGNAGFVNRVFTNYWSGNSCYTIDVNADKANWNFVYYWLKSKESKLTGVQQKGVIPAVSKKQVEEFLVPVPPLEVQREIVRILDSFTELTAELAAELAARKKQYEYYRDKLLTFNGPDDESVPCSIRALIQKLCPDGVAFMPFGESATILRGASPRPINSFITSEESGVNWIKIGDIAVGSKYVTHTKEKITTEGSQKSRFVRKGDFILSNSMSFGRPYILKIDGCIHDGWLAVSNFSNSYNSDFLFYLLNSTTVQHEMAKRASFGGAVQNLNADIVKSLVLPVPPLEVQREIVRILDKFTTLCTDISTGLPAEIAARQKQYEYYRDKLLTFKEAPVQATIFTPHEENKHEKYA